MSILTPYGGRASLPRHASEVCYGVFQFGAEVCSNLPPITSRQPYFVMELVQGASLTDYCVTGDFIVAR